jgi:hypothetical protein
MMGYQHNLALKHHCRFAFETAHPRFHFFRRGASVILTVNSGYE